MLTFICKQHNRYPFCTCPRVCTQTHLLTQTHTAHYRGTEVYVSAVFHLPRSNHCHRLVCLILCKFEMGSVVDQKNSFSLLYLHVNSTIKFNFTQIYSVIHTVKGFGIVNKAEIDVFLELSCFFDDPWMLAIWSLVPLPFLNPAWTSGSSQFTYCWSLAWRILSITLLACAMSEIVK